VENDKNVLNEEEKNLVQEEIKKGVNFIDNLTFEYTEIEIEEKKKEIEKKISPIISKFQKNEKQQNFGEL
jgi:hypothetical protein